MSSTNKRFCLIFEITSQILLSNFIALLCCCSAVTLVEATTMRIFPCELSSVRSMNVGCVCCCRLGKMLKNETTGREIWNVNCECTRVTTTLIITPEKQQQRSTTENENGTRRLAVNGSKCRVKSWNLSNFNLKTERDLIMQSERKLKQRQKQIMHTRIEED